MSSEEEVSPHSRKKFKSERSFEVPSSDSLDWPEGDKNVFGPVLPPHLLQKKLEECRNEQKIYGPMLPDNLRAQNEKKGYEPEFNESETKREKVVGPEPREVPINDDMESTEDCFGPSLSLMSSGVPSSSYHVSFIGQKRVNTEIEEETSKQREKWMIELPEERTGNLSLGTRRFNTRITTDKEKDRSVWIETPEDKKKKKRREKDYSEILKSKMIDERNKEMEKLIESAKRKHKKKEQSLMEIHTKKLKKKKKEMEKEKKQPERRPFDRDVDLQIRRVDEGQRRVILNKAMYLNSKFAAGESKFL